MAVSSLDTLLAHEPQPTITIVCQKVPVPGQPSQVQLQPQLTFTSMPGGWDTVLTVLLQATAQVAQEMVRMARQEGDKRIAVIPAMPGELMRQ
jgi:hypothetical protein